MIEIKKENCCGCGACAQVCPKGCISMQTDNEGFAYPLVDTQACVNCGLCEKVCPIGNKTETACQPVEAHVAYTKDDAVREASSSGGMFSVLASKVLERQGVVFGAAFADDFSVHHIKIESQEDILLLRGSKYTQSSIENTYCEAKQLLQEGRTVLFTGVACQIAGLKAFLGKEYDGLYTVDVLCHGVPSPAVWSQYVQEQRTRYGANPTAVSFRDKRKGWKNFSMVLCFDNGSSYAEVLSKDAFMRCFLSNICLRPSCHSCKFKDFPRLSDLTIGDAWGVQKHSPEMDDDRGASVVVINSEKGQQLWEQVLGELNAKQGELNTLLPQDADSRRSVKAHPNRKRFFTALSNGAKVEQLVTLTKKPLLRRMLSFGKRQLKRILRK